jgi:putative nucleotidyltransferase with HDIG domain
LTKKEALEIVDEFIKNPGLKKHCLAVGAAMKEYARKFGEDEKVWEVTGILHDFDWEIHPNAEEHPAMGAEILRERGVNEETITAILSHADYMNVPRETIRQKTLYAVDELTGLLIACALVKPSKSIHDVTLDSVKSKWNKLNFAGRVNREDIERGAADLGVEMDEHIQTVLTALQNSAKELGLNGDSD